MKREDIIQNLLYGFLLSAFLFLYFILSMNYRLAADDFYFLKNFEDHGWWQSMSVSWQAWVTRWASILWLNVIFGLYKLTGSFLFFHIITLLMLCFALYRLSSSSIDFFLKHRMRGAASLSALADLPRHSRFTVSFLISFFFLIAGIDEIFFWITSSAMYLWGFIAFCFLLSEILKGEKSFNSFFTCLVTAAFVGGSAEAIAVPAFFVLLIVFTLEARKKTFKAITALSIVVLVASILASYWGEGRVLRQSALPHNALGHSLLITFKAIAQVELFFIKEKFLWAILFFVAWMGFAERVSLRLKFKSILVVKVVGWYALLCFLFVFPTCYLLGEIPPHRAWLLIGFLNCCIISLGGILAGAIFHRPQILKIISSVAVGVLVVMIGRLALDQKQITTDYSHAVDARMQFLTTLVDPEDSTTIILDQLPGPGLLTSSEIGVDTSDFRNQHLKNYLRLKANLRVK